MTGVYSGGLVYEYSMEKNNYGLVKLDGDSVTLLDDFTTLKNAFKKTPAPSGDGGYKSSGSPSECPAKSNTWNVTISADQLPAYPKAAADYMKNGCKGAGPGLKGAGSQEAGSAEENLAGEADGAVTSGGATPAGSKGASSSLRPGEFGMGPIVCGAIVLVSSLLGGSLIL